MVGGKVAEIWVFDSLNPKNELHGGTKRKQILDTWKPQSPERTRKQESIARQVESKNLLWTDLSSIFKLIGRKEFSSPFTLLFLF